MQRNLESKSPPLTLVVHLRHDQKLEDIGDNRYKDKRVLIYAPQWVETGLRTLSQYIPNNTQICVLDKRSNQIRIKVENGINLKQLMVLSRNESSNVSGIINFDLYGQLKLDHKSIIFSIKDLARQCITIGIDETTQYGGYPKHSPICRQNNPVIIIDLIGLQFQQAYNTGRLVLIGEGLPKGLLDDIIFRNVVGENKKSMNSIGFDKTERYVLHNKYYFDTYAYERFVANDFLLVCKALNQTDFKDINLKFLKYGTGFFAGPFGYILEKHIMNGIYQGMTEFFNTAYNMKIKCFEFPFYPKDARLSAICKQANVKCCFSNEDALKHTVSNLMVATTNCADPHAVTGNEMRYSSVDAAIAENLKSKAHKFSPIINQDMSSHFIDTRITTNQFTHQTQGTQIQPISKLNIPAKSMSNDYSPTLKPETCPTCGQELNLISLNENMPIESKRTNENLISSPSPIDQGVTLSESPDPTNSRENFSETDPNNSKNKHQNQFEVNNYSSSMADPAAETSTAKLSTSLMDNQPGNTKGTKL